MDTYKKKYIKYKKKYMEIKGGKKCSDMIDVNVWKNKKVNNKDFITLHNNSLFKLLIPSTLKLENAHIFSNKIKNLNKVSDQKSSGRCWMFAGLNVIRHKFINDNKLQDDFEFSQNYLFFWDKFERMNYIVYLIEDLYKKDEPLNSRTIYELLNNFIDDGGTWEMLINLINKYGLVPRSAFSETYHSSNTGNINTLLKKKLREYTRDIYNSNFDKRKMLDEIYLLLVKFFGQPPNTFDWEYVDKNKKYNIKKNLNPNKFYKMTNNNLEDYIYFIHDPRNEYKKVYSVDYMNNMVNGLNTRYLNIDMNTMKNLVKKSIDKNEGVYFACDVNKYLLSKKNVLDTDAYKIDDLLHINFNLTKKERLQYFDSEPNHAMVITGYNKDGSKINRWKIENSWGEKKDTDSAGYYSMTDKWMEEYVFEVSINKKHVPSNLKNIWKQDVYKNFPLWDPFGTLA